MAEKKTVWDKNFASNKKLADRVREYYTNKMRRLRYDRTNLEEEWMKFFKMWNVTKDGYAGYNGRAQLYIPEVRKSVEAQARKLTHAAFSQEEWFDCSPGADGTPEGAQINKSVRTFQANQAMLELKYFVYARQQCLYGTSPIYVPWRKETVRAFRSKRDARGKVKPAIEDVELFNGPEFVVRDLFRWYSLNPKEPDVQKSGCGEFFLRTIADLKKMEADGELYGLEDILKGPGNAYLTEELLRDVERAEAQGLQIQDQGYAGEASLVLSDDKDNQGTFKVCRIFDRMVAPEMCEKDEDPTAPIPVQIEFYNDGHVGLIRRNPFFHQKVPYLVGHYILPNADEGYGQGIPKAIQYMQYEINSTAEQTMDSKTLALNPIALVDPGLAGQVNDFIIEPGATWFVNPAGVKFGSVPDLTQTGYVAINQIRGLIQDHSDRNPALPSELTGKSRSATQSDIVSQSLSIDDEAFQKQNEMMVLNPLMEMWESLTDQNIEGDQVIMLLGRRASDWKRILVTKNQTLGRYRYTWKAASSIKNKSIVARQMLDMMKVIGSLPPDALQGIKFNWGEAVKTLWRDLFQLPDPDKILGLPEDMQSQDPEVEHRMLELGMNLQVLPGDDDQGHLKAHDQEMAKLKKENDVENGKQLLLHIFKHRQQLQAKVQVQQQIAQAHQQAIQMAAQQNAQGGKGGKGGPAPAGGGMQGSGNRTQMSPGASVGDQASGVRP